MAEASDSNRTEKATPERLKRARKEGQIAVSQELPSVLMLVAVLFVLVVAGAMLFEWSLGEARSALSLQSLRPVTRDSLGKMLSAQGWSGLGAVLPFLLAAGVASVAGSLLVSGWAFSPSALAFKFDRLSIASGFKQLFSLRSAVSVATSAAKVAVVGWIVWNYLADQFGRIGQLWACTPLQITAAIGSLTLGLLLRLAVGLAAIAAVDVLYQKLAYARKMRMSFQEVKDERRQYELSPEVKGRMRAVMIAMTRRRMLREVPKADVVVANPTHYAVALRYDARTMAAPVVVAKGADLLAEKVKEIARAHGVPILYRPEVARALFASAQIGAPVPETLFVAVAELLALVYRLRRRRLGSIQA